MPTTAELLASKMRELIPRKDVRDPAIQAAIAGDHRARVGEGRRKKRAAKCYGGDISRKAQAAREAEGRQEAHEASRESANPAGSVLAVLKMPERTGD